MESKLVLMLDGLTPTQLDALLPAGPAPEADPAQAARVAALVAGRAAVGGIMAGEGSGLAQAQAQLQVQGQAEAKGTAARPRAAKGRAFVLPPSWRRRLPALAAGLVLAILAGSLVARLAGGGGAPARQNMATMMAPAESTAAAAEEAAPAAGLPELSQDTAGGADGGALPAGAVTIPAITLPEAGAGAAVDMMALVVYQGRVYTQAETLYVDSAAQQQAYLGAYLGEATGSIDEWSTQSDYAVELASTAAGPVYQAAGYAPDFRIAIAQAFDEAGDAVIGQAAQGTPAAGTVYAVWYFECLNGVTLENAGALYDTRLHLPGNVSAVGAQSHADWENARQVYHSPALEQPQVEEFIAGLCAAPLEEWSGGARASLYGRPQVHVSLELADGTAVPLRLIEGGYVRYESMPGHIFAKMEGPAFDEFYAACLLAADG